MRELAIGKSIALGLSSEGANLTLAARDAVGLKATKDTMAAFGVHVEAVTIDITKEEQIEALVANKMESFQRFDILVNKASAFDEDLSIKFLRSHGIGSFQ